MDTWDLKPGEIVERKALQDRYGGRTQGGIGPSRKSPNVLIFSDPASGEKHGYIDSWMPDGCFHYTGEGQFGDQRLVSGNASILRHHEEGRALRVFEGARGRVKYVGEFEVDDERPWYEADAPESGGGTIRQVIVFRLRPVDTRPQPAHSRLADAAAGRKAVEVVAVEEQWTEKAFVDPVREPYEAERREAALVLQLRDFLRLKGHLVQRLRIWPDGEAKPIFVDLIDATAKVIVEAKGTATREAVRMAIGQLVDYGRFAAEARRAILLPSRPRADLEALGTSVGIAFVWPADGGFTSNSPDILPASK
jgi:hypothetical protein